MASLNQSVRNSQKKIKNENRNKTQYSGFGLDRQHTLLQPVGSTVFENCTDEDGNTVNKELVSCPINLEEAASILYPSNNYIESHGKRLYLNGRIIGLDEFIAEKEALIHQ